MPAPRSELAKAATPMRGSEPSHSDRVSLRARARESRRGQAGLARTEALRVGLVVAGLGVFGILSRAYLVRQNGEARVELRGTWLGMTPTDVRDRFRAPGAGTWRSEQRTDPALIWTAAEGAPPTTAYFEFHGGVLVAVRLTVPTTDPAAQGPALDVSTASVMSRQDQTDGAWR
jgi:hypothetical protein